MGNSYAVPIGGRKGIQRAFSLLLFVLLLLSYSFPARAENNIVKIGGDVTVAEGRKAKNVVTVGGQITVGGTVTGHVMAIGGSVVLVKRALVEGNVISVGGVIVMGKDARVHGKLKEINASDISASLASVLNEEWEGWSWVFAVLSLLVFIGVLILAVILITLLPRPICLVAGAIREYPFKVFFWGLLVLISIVPFAVLLAISVMGIVLIPLEMAMVACSALIGFIAVSQIAGEKMFALLKKKDQSVIADVFWGLILLWIIGWIPHIGWMIKVIAVVIGLGGVFTACIGVTKRWKKNQVKGEEADNGGKHIS